MTVGRSEQDESTIAIAVFLGLREQHITGDDDGCLIRSTASGLRDSASVWTVKAEESCKSASRMLLDQRQDRRNLVDVDLRAETLLKHTDRITFVFNTARRSSDTTPTGFVLEYSLSMNP